MTRKNKLKPILLFSLLFLANTGKAQTIDSIYVNLYTDSLKKGTYNYINIDGKMSNGHYLPLDSTDIIFTASGGKFYGNSLWIDKRMDSGKVHIKVALKKRPTVIKEFDIWIKTTEDAERLRTTEEILNGDSRKKRKG